MPGIDDFLDKLKGEDLEKAKKELVGLLEEAKADAEDLARSTGTQIEGWLKSFGSGRMTKQEFELLLRSKRREVEQKLNTLEIKAKARVQKIVMGILDVLLDQVLKRL